MKEEIMGKLDGKIVLITGGTSGIGAAAAELAADEGASVILVGRGKKRGLAEEEKIRKKGGQAVFISCDMTQKDEIEKLREIILEKFQRLDVLVNSIGVLKTAALEEINEDNWETVFETNVNATVYCCKAFLPMIRESKGCVLNIASNVGLQSAVYGRTNYAYASSKAALIQFTQLLAKNYAPDVRINCLCPGPTATDLWENKNFERFKSQNLLGKVIMPEEVARTVLFLISEDSAIMTGSVVVADAGANLKA